MVAQYVQVATDGPGKKIQTFENTLAVSGTVEAQAVTLVDQYGTAMYGDPNTQANITILNANLASATPTAGSTIQLNAGWGQSAATVQVNGTWTGTLIFQVSNDQYYWFTVPAIQVLTTGLWVSSISSGSTGLFSAEMGGWGFFRVTASSAMTGTAAVSARLSTGFTASNIPVSVTGAPQTTVTGTITAASTVVGGATDYGSAGNLTVVFAGTYAGVNANFQASTDGGTNWVNVQGQRTDSGIPEASTGILPANTSRAWNFSLMGFNRFRVQTTAWTSGSVGVTIDPGTFPFVPVVSAVTQCPPRSAVTITFNTAAPVVAETLVSSVKTIASVAAGGATSIAVTAGKTLRITAVALSIRSTTAAVPWASMIIRSNPTGATLIGSPSLFRIECGGNAAAIGNAANMMFEIPDGIEFTGAQTLGMTLANSVTTNIASLVLLGYEY